MNPPTRPTRLQRSELAVPATSPRFFPKAAQGAADSLFLDLEDAVAPGQKHEARAQAIQALQQLDWRTKTVAVRVNGLDTPWALQDIVDIARVAPRLDLILLPKTSSAASCASSTSCSRGWSGRRGAPAASGSWC